jgi:hypothetical protein
MKIYGGVEIYIHILGTRWSEWSAASLLGNESPVPIIVSHDGTDWQGILNTAAQSYQDIYYKINVK